MAYSIFQLVDLYTRKSRDFVQPLIKQSLGIQSLTGTPFDGWWNNRPIVWDDKINAIDEKAEIVDGKLVITLKAPKEYELDGKTYQFNEASLEAFRRCLGDFKSGLQKLKADQRNEKLYTNFFKWALLNPTAQNNKDFVENEK